MMPPENADDVRPPWVWTDDPADPCTLCLSWTDYDMDKEGTPWLASGQVAPRVWRGIHPDCQKMLDEYEADVAHDCDQSDGQVSSGEEASE